jgi:hypothetical protein
MSMALGTDHTSAQYFPALGALLGRNKNIKSRVLPSTSGLPPNGKKPLYVLQKRKAFDGFRPDGG